MLVGELESNMDYVEHRPFPCYVGSDFDFDFDHSPKEDWQ